MLPASLDAAAQWVIAHGYPLMFLAMCVEGPGVAVAAGFAAAMGFFHPGLVVVLSVLGDLVPDALLYGVGAWGRTAVVERWGHRLGLTSARIQRFEQLLRAHPLRAVVAAKFMPVLAMPCLMLVGSLRLDVRRFLAICALVSVPRSLLLVVVGYQFGWAYDALSLYLQSSMLIGLGAIAVVALALALRRWSARIERYAERGS